MPIFLGGFPYIENLFSADISASDEITRNKWINQHEMFDWGMLEAMVGLPNVKSILATVGQIAKFRKQYNKYNPYVVLNWTNPV